MLASLIAAVRARNHGTAAHIGRNAATVETAATFTDRLATLSIPHVAIEASAISRRDADAVVTIIAAIR